MLKYLQETLGLSASEKAWLKEQQLPLYLKSKRSYSVLSIENLQFLLIRLKESEFSIQTYLKQQSKLSQYWNHEIVLCFDRLSTYQKKVLIEQKISFIVPGNQIFIPILGMVLMHQKMSTSKRNVTRFSASTQMIFLFILYNDVLFPMKKAEIARRLMTNAMNVTRAVQDLESLKLIRVETKGRSDYIFPLFKGRELFEQAKKYLTNPIRKKLYVEKNTYVMQLPLCGEEALSKLSMVSTPEFSIRAIDRKKINNNLNLHEIDLAWCLHKDYCELEVWMYDPSLFIRDGMVDIASLYMSFDGNYDERIEDALEYLLEEYKWS